MTLEFDTWVGLRDHILAIARVRAFASRGICVRRNIDDKRAPMICVLRSVDETPYYCDRMDAVFEGADGHPHEPGSAIEYTFAGRTGNQSLEKPAENKTLAHGTGRVFVYRVCVRGDAKKWTYMGEYERAAITERTWPDKDGKPRTVFVAHLVRI